MKILDKLSEIACKQGIKTSEFIRVVLRRAIEEHNSTSNEIISKAVGDKKSKGNDRSSETENNSNHDTLGKARKKKIAVAKETKAGYKIKNQDNLIP